MRVFLVRHGQSSQNAEDMNRMINIDEFRDLLLAANRSHLTELGIEQAQRAALDLADQGITHIYASPYDRAQHTAQIIAEQLNVPVTTIFDLHEINAIVPWIGRRKPRTLKAMYIRGYLHQFLPHKRGETWWQARRRIIGAWNSIMHEWRPSTVSAIVAHNGVNWTLLRYLERHGGWRIVRRNLDNGGISELEQI